MLSDFLGGDVIVGACCVCGFCFWRRVHFFCHFCHAVLQERGEDPRFCTHTYTRQNVVVVILIFVVRGDRGIDRRAICHYYYPAQSTKLAWLF